MEPTFGLSLETDFIEVSGPDGFHRRYRWNHTALPKDMISDIKTHCDATPRIQVLPPPTESFVIRGQIKCPALITTSGMEHWLDLQGRYQNQIPSDYISYVDTHDRVFPVFERTSATGDILKPLELEELEALHSKFEMEKVETIAICFLHSTENNTNENQAYTFFKEKGYQVFKSCDWDNFKDEVVRWSQCLRTSFTASLLSEDLKVIEGLEGESSSLDVIGATDLAGSNELSFFPLLENWFKKSHLVQDFAYFGFDEFFYAIRSEAGPHVQKLKIQASSPVSHSIWGQAMVNVAIPGSSSILLSPSLRPNVFDVLILGAQAKDRPDIFDSFDFAKLQSRFQEILFSFSSSENSKTSSIIEDQTQLEKSVYSFILNEILLNRMGDQIHFAGPLASIVKRGIESLKPPFELELVENYAFFKSQLLSSGGNQD